MGMDNLRYNSDFQKNDDDDDDGDDDDNPSLE